MKKYFWTYFYIDYIVKKGKEKKIRKENFLSVYVKFWD